MKRKIFLTFVCVLLGLSTVFSYAATAKESACRWFITRSGTSQPSFGERGQAVSEHGGYFLDTRVCDTSEDKVLYLTFDAGYENGNIARILDIMNEKNVDGAFFVLDNLIIKNTELVKRMKAEGHLVCNHTKNHKDLSSAGAEAIRADLDALDVICEKYAGFKLDRYFRFPEGKYSINALKTVSDMGYKTVFWSFAYEDWDNAHQPSADFAKKKILSNTHNGAVILLHPTSDTNAAILGDLIDAWREMGYRFGTLHELCNG